MAKAFKIIFWPNDYFKGFLPWPAPLYIKGCPVRFPEMLVLSIKIKIVAPSILQPAGPDLGLTLFDMGDLKYLVPAHRPRAMILFRD